MQYTYPKVTTLAHDSAATLVPLPASISAHLSGSCTKAIQGTTINNTMTFASPYKMCIIQRSLIFGDNVQMAEPATMPLPCDLSFQIRVLFQLCYLDSWISDGFANSISHSVTWGALHEFISFLSKVIEWHYYISAPLSTICIIFSLC